MPHCFEAGSVPDQLRRRCDLATSPGTASNANESSMPSCRDADRQRWNTVIRTGGRVYIELVTRIKGALDTWKYIGTTGVFLDTLHDAFSQRERGTGNGLHGSAMTPEAFREALISLDYHEP